MKVFVSGLVNIESTLKIEGFPLPYYPIDYPFFWNPKQCFRGGV